MQWYSKQHTNHLLRSMTLLISSYLGNPSVTSVIKSKLDSPPMQTLMIDCSKRKKTDSPLKVICAVLLSLPLVAKLDETFY